MRLVLLILTFLLPLPLLSALGGDRVLPAPGGCLFRGLRGLADPTGALLTKGWRDLSTEYFEVTGVRNGRHGGNRIVVRRKLAWGDRRVDFGDGGSDYMADLRITPTLLGKDGADFFGYRILSDSEATVPEVEEVRGAIGTFNASLSGNSPTRILIRPRRTSQVFEADQVIVDGFIEDYSVPHASSGRQFWHDSTGHAMTGFTTPNAVAQRIRGRARIWKAFWAELGRKAPELAAKSGRANQQAIKDVSSQIDNLGNLTGLFIHDSTRARWSRELKDLGREVFADKRFKGSGEPLAAHAAFGTHALVPPGWSIQRDSWKRVFLASPLEQYSELLPPEARLLLESFLADYARAHPEDFAPLGFDVEAEVATLRSWQKRETPPSLDELRSLHLSRPFAERVERLQGLVSVGK